MDYDVKMLKLYFEEMNYSNEEIENLLNTNPFNNDYQLWLNRRNNNAKTLAICLTKNSLININNNIQEILIHEKDSISKHLRNEKIYSTYSSSYDINKVRLSSCDIVLIRGNGKNQEKFLHNLCKWNKKFIIGECTKDTNYYEKTIRYYKKLRNELSDYCKLYEFQNYNQKICVLKKS